MRLTASLLFAVTAWAGVVADVRVLINKGDLAGAERTAAEFRSRQGETPEYLEAWSWLGRGALGAKQYDQADRYASETYEKVLETLGKTPLEGNRHLQIALGAAIEVRAQAAAARGERDQAVVFLKEQLQKFHGNAVVRTRTQKNLNLLTLESRPAPKLDASTWLGVQPKTLAALRGTPVLLFFWAHWCSDCKNQVPVLAKLAKEYPELVIMGPTQRYGYVQQGREAGPEEETRYIDKVRGELYGALADMAVPVSEENFRAYGASTTPTLVLIDRNGIVRLYHPGEMSYEELKPKIAATVRLPSRRLRYQNRRGRE